MHAQNHWCCQQLITSDHNHNEQLSYNNNRFCWIEVERWKEEGKDMKNKCTAVCSLRDCSLKIHFLSYYMFLKIFFFFVCVPQGKEWHTVLEWHSKLCQNFHFAVKYPFNLNQQWIQWYVSSFPSTLLLACIEHVTTWSICS